MSKFLQKAKELLVSEEGATATEYAVMLALIIVVSIVAIGLLGDKVQNTFEVVDDNMP